MRFDIIAGDSATDEYGRIWIWDAINNVIGYFVSDKYDFNIVSQFKYERFQGLAMHLDGNVIYIVSQYKAEVLAYDMEKCSFRIFMSELRQEASRYYSARLNDYEIILVAYELRFGAVLFDIRTGCFEKIILLETDKYNDGLAVRLVETENEIIIAVSSSNEILRFKKKDLSYSAETIPFLEKIGGVCAERGNNMWIISKNADCLVRIASGNSVRIGIGEKKEKDMFSRLVKYGDKIIALPRYATQIYVYDISKEQMKIIEIPMKVGILEEGSSLFWNCFIRNDKLVMLPWRCRGILLELDLNTLQIVMHTANVSADTYWEYNAQEVMWENTGMDLKALLELAGKKNKKSGPYSQIGKEIWRGLTVKA